MPAYVVYQGEVTDPDRYTAYSREVPPTLEAAGGRFLVRGGAFDVLEGDAPAGRTVVIEFPDRQAALDWYHGEAYTEVRRLREGAAITRMYVVDGVVPS